VTHPEKWEYLAIAEQEAGDLNALGDQGWELAGVSGRRLYFKRPAMSFRERVTLDQKRHYYGLLQVPFEDERGPSS
jgi:hypothetical protein